MEVYSVSYIYQVPKCPNCGYEDHDWHDGLKKEDGDTWDTVCADCGEKLRVTMGVITSFKTEILCTSC